ncbi:hypothetical protein [Kribbella sp. NPDC051718]|uniref:hypothetical protein n=1 Tax=Kribbella sp. NPDC051718 TaxID=3155168 RepID=UPI00341901AA
MNDTETRLRDYLQTKAGEVPDSAQGPGLEPAATGTPRRRWAPMVLAAASIGAVLILVVPFLDNLINDSPATSAPVSTGPLRIPYTVIINNKPDQPLDTWWVALHDGEQTIKNPGVEGSVLDRLDQGWLGKTGDLDPKKAQAVVIGPTGKVRPIGPAGVDDPVLSPDGRQIAVVIAPYGAKESRVVVLNVADRRQVSEVKVPTPMMMLVGWNKDGIWMQPPAPPTDPQPTSVWRPGSAEVREVGDLVVPLEVARGSGTVIQTTYSRERGYCLKPSTLGAQGLVAIREFCAGGGAYPYPALSSNGALMALDTGDVLDVASGRVAKLRLPDGFESSFAPVFEDSGTVILLASSAKDQKIFRCGIANGDCVPIVTAKAKEILALVRP